MSTQFENYSVSEINFIESVGNDLGDLGAYSLILTPDAGYVIDAGVFNLVAPIPSGITNTSFNQAGPNVRFDFTFSNNTIMPANDIEFPLCFGGYAELANFIIQGSVDIVTTNATPLSQLVPYSSSGEFNSSQVVYTETIIADTNNYFYVEPIAALITGNALNYNITSTKQYDGPNGELTSVTFSVEYTYPNQNVSGDLIRIIADAIPIINIVPLVSAFTFDGVFGFAQPNVAPAGDNQTLVLTGDPGAVFSVSFFEDAGSGTETVYATDVTMPASGNYTIPNIIFPSFSAGTPPYQVQISGDINPIITNVGDETHVDFNQYEQLNLEVSGSTSNSDLTLSGTPDTFDLLTNNTYIPSVTFDFDFKATSIIPIIVQNPVTASSFNPVIPDPNSTDPNGNYVYDLASIDTVLKEPGHVLTASLASGGTEYTDGNFTGVVTQTSGNGIGLTLDITVSGGVVTTISIADGGVGYSIGDTATIFGAVGDDAIVNILDILPGYEYCVDGAITLSSSGSSSVAHDLNLDNHIITVNPPTVTTTAISNITGTSADSGGESITDGGGTISSKGIEWSEFADFSTILGTNDEGSGTANFSSQMTGLNPGPTYYVRAFVENEAGKAYGQVISFVTASLPTIVTKGVTGETGTEADSGGESITDGNGTISSKGIQWSEVADFSTILGANNEGTGTADFNSTITGLTTGNTYYVRAYAQNEVGIGYGQVIGFVSNITIPCSSTASSGAAGITDLNINLDSGGGLIALQFTAFGVPDKMEIIHGGPDGTKVATSGFDNGTDGNSGPFDNVYGTEPSNTVPTPANVANTSQFIGTNKGTAPTRETQFNNETGYTANMTGYQQMVWWEYTAADWQNAPNVTVRVTGSTGTQWRFRRLCCPDANCTVDTP